MSAGSPPAELTERDVDHLRWLAIGHYVLGGMTVLCGFFPVIHLTVGIAFVSGVADEGPNPPPAAMGWIFIVAAVLVMISIWTLAGLTIAAGMNLRRRRRHTFCFVVAVLVAAFLQPLGLVLGLLTILVLVRPGVKAAFDHDGAHPSDPPPPF